jgi:hypothetical protein
MKSDCEESNWMKVAQVHLEWRALVLTMLTFRSAIRGLVNKQDCS